MNESIMLPCHTAAVIELHLRQRHLEEKKVCIDVFSLGFAEVVAVTCEYNFVKIQIQYNEDTWTLTCSPEHFYIQDILRT